MSVPPPGTDWFSFLKIRPYQRITSYWLNQLVDAISLTYDMTKKLWDTAPTVAILQNLPVDIIPQLPDVLKLGSPDKPFGELYVDNAYVLALLQAQNISAFYGSISGDLYVQGKRVLKDDDPIHIADFWPTALTQLAGTIYSAVMADLEYSQATDAFSRFLRLALDDQGRVYAIVDVDSLNDTALTQLASLLQTYVTNPITSALGTNLSSSLSSLADVDAYYLSKLDSDLNSCCSEIGTKIDTQTGTIATGFSTANTYLAQIGDTVAKVYQRLEGPLGVIVVQPVDQYGNVRTRVVDAFESVYVTKTITATENTAGLEVVLNKGGRPNVNFFYSVGGAATIYVEVSVDGINWRRIDTITTFAAQQDMRTYSNIAYPYIRARTDTTGVDVLFELVASR
ncbi:MAG: hypothetical protein ABGW50_01680 [Thermococcus sp.]